MTSSTVGPRYCEGCGEELPVLSRPNRRHHNSSCRARATRKRQRREVPAAGPPSGPFAPAPELEAAVARATDEVRLLALVAKEANGGSWRAAAWLLERRYPSRWGSQRAMRDLPPPLPEDAVDPFTEFDQLAHRRRRRDERRPEGY